MDVEPAACSVSPACVATCVQKAVQAVLDNYRPSVVAFDTETTGLRGAVIQAALVEVDAHGTERSVFSGIVPPPDGYRLEPAAVAVHRITQRRIDAEGQPAVPFFRTLVTALKRARDDGKRVVAHNASFDVARLNETLVAHGMHDEQVGTDLVFCTMHGSKRHCGLTNRRGAMRCPKNAELYELLTGEDVVEAVTGGAALHDAATDARITARSYLEGRRRGWWA